MIPLDFANGMLEHPVEIVAQETDIFDMNSTQRQNSTFQVKCIFYFLCLT